MILYFISNTKKIFKNVQDLFFACKISVDFEISSLLSSIPPCFGSILDAFPLCIRLSWDKIITRYQWQSTRVNIRNIRDFIDDIREVYSVPFYIKIVIHIHVWMKTGNLTKKMEGDPLQLPPWIVLFCCCWLRNYSRFQSHNLLWDLTLVDSILVFHIPNDHIGIVSLICQNICMCEFKYIASFITALFI